MHPPTAAGPQDVELRRDDVLVLAVKSQDTAAALAAWADRPVAGGGTAAERLAVVCAQNGVDNERAALRRFATVVAMCVWLPATYLEPGRVSAGGTPVPGVLTVGPAAPSADPDLVTAYARDLTDAGLRAPVTADVMAWKYRKLLSNLANAVEALCGTARDDAAAELAARADAEGRAVLPCRRDRRARRGRARRRARRLHDEPPARAGAHRRVVVAVAGPRHRVDRGRPPQRRDRAPGPAARRADPGERGPAAARPAGGRDAEPTPGSITADALLRESAAEPSTRTAAGAAPVGAAPAAAALLVGTAVRRDQEAEHVTLGHVQLPPCWTVNPNDVV